MADEPTDEELMARYIEQGSEPAFSELYRRYELRLFGFFVKRLLPSMRDRAPDLFQKTWLKIHASRQQFQSSRRFSPWLFSIALNTFRDELKRKDIGEDERSGLGDFDIVSKDEDAETGLAKKEDFAHLERALTLLSGPDREALILSEWEGLTSEELSELWKISAVAARQRVSRAKKRVRAILTQDAPGGRRE